VARDSSFTISGGAFDAVADENSVVFTGDDKYRIALEIKSYIENYVPSDSRASTPSGSVAEEIAKFKILMDQGVVTREEFEAKKRQLLSI
jgi:hypothetical protein